MISPLTRIELFMEGDGMVAVVRGLREAGLAVTLLDGNRQYTLLPNTTTQPATSQRAVPKNIVHASTQQYSPRLTTDTSTEPATPQCDRDAQAVDGRYASTYKTMHCNVRPTSPPVQLTEFPPQRPELYPGHGNFIVGGTGSGMTGCPIRPSSPINSFRGGMNWPDRGSVCSPRPSRMEDAFVRSLRKYPNCLSPDRSSEVIERLVNYTQAKGSSRNYRTSQSPNRSFDPSSQSVIEPKPTFNVASRSRSYEPDVKLRPRKSEDPPTRDRRKEDERPVRGSYDVRYLRDLTKRMRESNGRPYTSYPYTHPVCPPIIRENHDCNPLSCDYQNSSNSVNMEIQAAVKMLSKEVSTLSRPDITRKTVAVPESPISSAPEDYVEGDLFHVENLDIRTSIKSIQTNFYPSDTTLKPKKSAQTVFSTIDFHSNRNRTVVSRKTKSHEAIKLTKDELKISLLELINEISDTVSKNTIRDELIKKLFEPTERNEHVCDRGKTKQDKYHKYVAKSCPTVCDYVGDYQDLVGKLKNCYGDAKHIMRSEIKPFRLSEYRQLDFVLKDWVNNLNLKTDNIGRYIDRSDLLNSVEDRIKELLKNWTKEDFDLKAQIVNILQEIPIEINKSYGLKSYLRKLVDVLLKRMRNVIVTEHTGRVRRRPFASRSKTILTEEDMRDFVREHLLNYINKYNSRISNDVLYELENELVDFMMDSIECIWCGYDDEIIDEMEIILQDLGKLSNKQAHFISTIMLQDLQDMLNNCVFNQTYTILNVSNNSGNYMNSTNNTDFSIGSLNEEDLQANLDRYTNELCLKINQWLDGLDIPRIQDSGYREVVVNDLAGDIIDRHKYVELNHTGKDSEQDQLEALKYQIFKWINKLVGDDNKETINHADKLLQMINSVPVPMLVNPKHQNIGGTSGEVGKTFCPNAGQSDPKPYSQTVQGYNQSKPCCGKPTCPNTPKDGRGINQSIKKDTVNRASGHSFGPTSPNNPWGTNTFSSGFDPVGNLSQSGQGNVGGIKVGTCGTCAPMLGPNQQTMNHTNQSMNVSSPIRPEGSVPVKKLNEDYDEYLKQWVKKIPIPDKTAAEKETTRLNVYNGVWKAVTKMKLDPNIFGHQYYCQDVFEEEVEQLLTLVPQSSDLQTAKPALKAQLLQKTLAMNDLIKSTNAPASFKQQLMDNIDNNLPERPTAESEEDKAIDELNKQNIADNYILFTRYKDEDNVKATVYKKKFLKKLDEYINKIKNRHNLAAMDTTAYANEIINSLEKIPTPNHSAIKDEADDILITTEVENWISDIPQNSTPVPLEKRRTRDAIVKKIQEIGLGGVSCCDGSFRESLKAELPKYLDKMSIQEGTDKDYLIDELANRIKNLSTSMRRVSFQEPNDYEEFSRNMPAASSMLDMSEDRRSYLVVGKDRVKCSPRQVGIILGGERQDSVPEHEVQWLSMERTEVPSQMQSGYIAPQGRQSPQLYNPNESGQMSQRAQSPQMYVPNASDCCAPAERSFARGNVSRDADPKNIWGCEMAPLPQKRQKMSMNESPSPANVYNRSGRAQIAGSQLYNPNVSLAGRSFPDQGNFGANAGPVNANWACGQAPVAQEDSQWFSMEVTQIPSQMRSLSIASPNMRSPQVYCPNSADQQFVPNTQAPFGSVVDVPVSSFTQGGPPTAPGQFSSDPQGRVLCTGPPCCPNPLCNNRIQSFPGPYSQPVPNSPGLRAPYEQGSPQRFPNAQFSPCCNVPNAGQSSPLPQEVFGQGSPGRFNQRPHLQPVPQSPGPTAPYEQRSPQRFPNAQGSPCCNVPNAGQSSPLPQEVFGQGSPGRFNQRTHSQPVPNSPGPRAPYEQGSPQRFPNAQGSPCCNVPNAGQSSPLPQGVFGQGGQGSPGRYNQSVGPAFGPVVQNTQSNLSGGPMFPQSNAASQSQGPQVSSVQGAPFSSTAYNPGRSFGPVDPAYSQVAPGGLSGQPLQGSLYQVPPNIGLGQGPGFANNTPRQSFGPHAPGGPGKIAPGRKLPYQGPNATQIGQVSQNSCCQAIPNTLDNSQRGQASIFGIVEGSGQGFSNAQGQATSNQTSKNPRPISASSQVPHQDKRPFNLQKMAGGRMGILGTSQVPGPSARSSSLPTGSGPNSSCCSNGAQGVGTDAIPAIQITTNDGTVQQPNNVNQSIQQPSNQNQCMQQPNQNQSMQRPCSTADKSLQVACMPPMFLRRPKGCSGPDRERERCKCLKRGRKFRPRFQVDPNTDENRPTPTKLGTDCEKKPTKESKNSKVKAVDVKKKEVINFKSVQTAFSTIDITTTKCKYCEIRSKSQEELTKTTKKQEVIKRTDHGKGKLQEDVTEWFEIHSDKVKVKLWGEKMKKLAQKMKEPGGEEKIRTKIEKYLKQAPEQYPETDNDVLEFRKQLPNNIVRKLKKMYSNPKEPNVNIFRMEIPKYCSRLKIENFKKAVLNWTKNLSIKKKDFLGRKVEKDDVFKYVAEKLEPLVLDRPSSDSEYKEALQFSITEIVNELPIAVSSHNKDFYLNKAIENLVDNIFTIEHTFSSTYIQPSTKEIKEFVKDEITFFLEKCRVAISTKRMEYLERELIDRLLDLADITDIDSQVADDVTKLLKEVSKLPEYKAKYFTNMILNDYKEFFFRENFFQQKCNSDRGRPEVYSDFQNATGLVELDAETSLTKYRQRLIEEIRKWLTKLNIPNDKKCMDSVINDLVSDIVDRYKYLSINPSATGTDSEELEQLKFQIFKWTNKFVGDEYMIVLEHAKELMKEINNIPKPSLQDSSEFHSLSPINTDIISNTPELYVDKLTEQIYDWYCELPVNFHTPQDARQIKRLIKELAEEIEKGLEKNEDEVTEKEVRQWTDKVFNKKLGYIDVQQLKNRINNVPYAKDNRANDLKQEKLLIRTYEDIVDEWIDTVPIAPIKLRPFINNKNEIVHSIAVKIFKIKSKLKQLPAEHVEMKLQEELSHWLKKLPLHAKVDNQNDRDKYAAKLVNIIQKQRKNNFLGKHTQVNDQSMDKQLEYVIMEWLRKLPLYRAKYPEEQDIRRHSQETVIKGLAKKIIQKIGDEDAYLFKEIFQQIRTLDPEQNDDCVQNTAFKLKTYLQKLDLYKDLYKQREKENKLLNATIEVWLKGLPLQITDANRFQKQKMDFIKSVKQLLSSGSDYAVMRKEILVFVKSLPLSQTKRDDLKYLYAEVSKLVKTLKGEPITDVPSVKPATSKETISDVIKVWTSSLPLQPVYCPRELCSFTDDMCSVITSILLNPDENSTPEQNDARLYREISNFLRKFPLIYELSSESHIFGMAEELSRSLKHTNLFQNDKYLVNNLTVYDVSVDNKNGTNNLGIESNKKTDINVNFETYTKQLVQQIDEWFDHLNLPQANQKGFKEVVINDLAADIVDRHKYLELNPHKVQSEEDELEHLKYQIFKWINKLVGEENHETIAHAEELMRRIKSIPVPMLVGPQDKVNAASYSSSQLQCCQERTAGQQNRNSLSAPPATSDRIDPANPNSKPCCSQEPPPVLSLSDEEAKEAMYEKFVSVFTGHCNALPLNESMPDAEKERRTIYNGIILTFFKLKADPVIENDYGYFEFILEETIDKLLDDLPQTEELKKKRHSWKTGVLESALLLLDEMHAVSDRPSFRQRVKDKFNRQMAVDNEIQRCFDLQQNFLNSVADAYILQVNYKEKDPVKANIYKNRLMGEIDKLVNHLAKEHNMGFRLLNEAKLRRITMKALEQVPVPTDDILKDEVEEIHLADEIEKWYKELPTRPLQNEAEGVLIKRMIDILAKKLNEMHKHVNDDLSMENKMKHEVSHFLEKRRQIQDGHVHKITDMVDVLHSRLKDRWALVQDPAGFDEFAKAKPLSSTLANVDNAEFLAPLMNAATSTSPLGQRTLGDSGYFIQPGQTMQSLDQVPLCSLMTSGVDSNISRQVPCGMTQGRPNEGYAYQQGTPSRSIQGPGSHRPNLEGSQYGPRQGTPQQTPQRSNLSQQVQSPKQNRQSPQSVQNAVYPSPKNGLGSCQTCQGREESINQSLRQVGLIPQEQHNMASQMQGPNMGPVPGSKGTGRGQLSVPSNQVRSRGRSISEAPVNVSSRGPTPTQGIGTTAEAAVGGTATTRETRATSPPLSSDEDELDGEFRVKCRCLEAYQRMRRMDYDEQCARFRFYRYPY